MIWCSPVLLVSATMNNITVLGAHVKCHHDPSWEQNGEIILENQFSNFACLKVMAYVPQTLPR